MTLSSTLGKKVLQRDGIPHRQMGPCYQLQCLVQLHPAVLLPGLGLSHPVRLSGGHWWQCWVL